MVSDGLYCNFNNMRVYQPVKDRWSVGNSCLPVAIMATHDWSDLKLIILCQMDKSGVSVPRTLL